MIWVGLGLFCTGLFLLALVDLFWPNAEKRTHDLAYKLGLTFFLLGIALSVIST